jgi:ClpP class serine protease
MSKALLLGLVRSYWLIDEQFAIDNIDLLHSFINGKFDETKFSALKSGEPAIYAIDGNINAGSLVTRTRWNSFDNAQPGSIAIINISGPVLKADNCGDPGSMSYASFIMDAANHPKIKGSILIMDTPGGQVEGTQSVADAVAFHATKKPIINFVQDGMMASAGYWMGASSSKIIASHNTCMIGSIGVMAKLPDSTTEAGKVHIIYADQSSEKNKSFQDAMGGKYEALRKEILNPLAENFIGSVKTAREGKINLSAGDPFKGKLYMANEALQIGLIDSIGTFQDCIDAIEETSNSTTNSNLNMTTRKVSILGSMFPFLASFFSAKVEAGKEETEIDFSLEKQKELNAKLETITALETKASDFEKKFNEATASLTAANLIVTKYKAAQKALEPEAAEADLDKVDVAAEIAKLQTGAAKTNPKLGHKGADANDEWAGYTAEERALLEEEV